jgi:peptide deformylase
MNNKNLVSGLVYLALILISTYFALSLQREKPKDFRRAERRLIVRSDSVMRVLNIFDPADTAVLRAQSTDLSDRSLRSKDFQMLAAKMLRTLTDPSQDGVGIAAPQVGINRRIVAVQRFDKSGEPFEVYPNIHIDTMMGPRVCGPEGCLSVPDRRGIVPRYREIVISWKDPATLQGMRDTVRGFTAVIFQHECDHLDGILYTDRADSVFVR